MAYLSAHAQSVARRSKQTTIDAMDNRLAHMDQASFLALRALGHGALVQFNWIYNRPINVDGLRRFHQGLGHGLLGRRVERSPLPFARDRWVACGGPEDIAIADTPRPRSDLSAWLLARACLPLDPEYGPCWHLGALPFEDGGTAVCLTASHTVVDGIALLQAVADAVSGKARDLGYPDPGSRSRRQALLEDAWQTIASAPELARAAAATARIALRQRKDVAASIASAPTSPRAAGEDQPVAVPSLAAYVDLAEWNERAKSLGGNSLFLLAGFAGRLGVRMGRVCDDGSVTISLPMSDRAEDDTRGNALVFPVVSADPTNLASDLREVRIKIKQALVDLSATSEEMLGPLPLTSFTPKWVARRAAGIALGAAGRPIGCSNCGDLDPAVNRPDGTDADYVFGRLIEPGISKRTLERMGGQLYVVSGRVHGKIWIVVNAYLSGRTNSQDALRKDLSGTFAEFDLAAEIQG
jgi:hypothetical protein